MPHILFISYDGLTDPLGQSQILPYLKGLTEHGYRFTIISCEKPVRYELLKHLIYNSIFEYPIKWYPLEYHKKPPVISSIWDLHLIKKTAKKLHKKDPFDMVHTRSGTPALAGLWLKKKLGIKFLNDIRDFYADSRVDSGQWDQKKIIYRAAYKYFNKKEQEELDFCDGAVCLTQKAKGIIKNSLKNSRRPLQVIPCSVDLGLFDPDKINGEEKAQLKDKLGLSEKDYIITYLGSIGTWYLADDLIEFFKVALRKIPHAKFLFICPDRKIDVKELVCRHQIPEEKIVITKAIRSEVPLLLSLGQFSVFFIKSCFSKQASSPTKHGEMMAMGMPVITNSGIGDLDKIIYETESGVVIKNLNEKEYSTAIDQMMLKEFDPKEIRDSAFRYYDLRNAVEKYNEIYSRILEEKKYLNVAFSSEAFIEN